MKLSPRLIASFIVSVVLLAIVIVVSVQSLRRPVELGGTALQQKVLIEDVVLEHVDSGSFNLEDLRGKIALVFFGFTNCPDVCPLTMARLARAYQELGEPEDVQVLMISVDPEHDSPEVVQQYAQAYHPSFIGLSGSHESVGHAAKSFYVGFRELPSQEGQFLHTEAAFLVDKQGYLSLIYAPERLGAIVGDIPKLQ